MQHRTIYFAIAAGLALCTAASAQQTGRTRSVPASMPVVNSSGVPSCGAGDLSLATDGEDGNFNGMSHSGTLVVLRNLSARACSVAAIPRIRFANRTGPLQAKGQMAGFTRPGMGHGPVAVPAIVAPGAELTSSLRWVSGEVYDKNVCISPTSLSVTIAGGTQATAFEGHLCGDAAHGGVTYEQTRFAPDPVYKPGAGAFPGAGSPGVR